MNSRLETPMTIFHHQLHTFRQAVKPIQRLGMYIVEPIRNQPTFQNKSTWAMTCDGVTSCWEIKGIVIFENTNVYRTLLFLFRRKLLEECTIHIRVEKEFHPELCHLPLITVSTIPWKRLYHTTCNRSPDSSTQLQCVLFTLLVQYSTVTI